MTKAQVGVFRHGMYGFAVVVTLSDVGPIPLTVANGAPAEVSNIHLSLTHAFDSSVDIERDLPLPGTPVTIVDAKNGVVQWFVQNGDLPQSGTYNFTLTIDFGPNARLISDGSFKVV